MSNDVISNWLEKAKSAVDATPEIRGVQVIRREEPRNNGMNIMDIAERIRPWLMKMFEGVRDENNMLVQPARVHGMALNLAQGLIKEEEQRKKASA
jgi:hypothetical protein